MLIPRHGRAIIIASPQSLCYTVSMLKKLPIGIQTLNKLIEENYLYIDKTKTIYELIQSGSVYFLSRPRRFGKSLLISTLEQIFPDFVGFIQ